MREYKKVSGERLGAAILDSIFVGILGFIPVAIYFAVTLDFGNLMDSLLVNLTFGEEGYNNFLIFSILAETIIGVFYFGYLPYKKNGQTFGKMILKIRAVDEYGDNLSFIKHTIRGIQNWGGYVALPLMLLILIDETTFILVCGVVGNLVNMAVFVSLVLIFARTDGRGIHDMLVGSYVVSCDEDFNKDFAMKTAQMSEWVDVVDEDDSGFKEEKKNDDEWNF